MENLSENGMEKKVYSHTYDSLVREIAGNMSVDEVKIYPKTEKEFDYRDLESWLGAVKFTEGKTPDIQANLSSDQGQKTLRFDIADQKVVEELDEKATKEELIYSVALTEAKMKVISNIAEEVYPAVAYQIEDYRKEMEKVREEVLGNKKEAVSLEEILGGLVNRKSMAAIILMGGMILAGCGKGPVQASAESKPVFPTGPAVSLVTEVPVSAATQEALRVTEPTSVPIEVSPTAEIKIEEDKTMSDEEYAKIANEAAIKAVESFGKQPYEWKKNNHCSSFASRYIEKLGIPVSLPKDYAKDPAEFPYASTIYQVAWLEKHYQGTEFLDKVTVDDLLAGKLWDTIKPGSVIYLQTRANHNGYNTYDHVVVFLGLDEKGEPTFAEFVPAMKYGPETGRSLKMVAMMYKSLGEGEWDLRTYDEKMKDRPQPEFLYATIFDAVWAAQAEKEQGSEIPK
jgi:hypothetical protein